MKTLNKLLGYLIAFLVGLMVLGCCWQVITRFLLNNPSKYTEEFLRYALIWMTMLGVPYAYGQERHISINIITKTFSLKGSLFTKMVIEIIVMILCVTVFIAGGIMVTQPSEADYRNPATHAYIEKYLKGVASVPTEDRMRLLRLIENMTMGTAAVGYLPESMLGAGSPQAQRIMIARQSNLEMKKELA